MEELRLVASSVVRSASQGNSHGGLYVVKPFQQQYSQVLDWNDCNIDWTGCGGERGLRGIAFDKEHMYVAASSFILVFDKDLKEVERLSHPMLLQCHEICIGNGKLHITSTGKESMIVYDIEKKEFCSILNIPSILRKENNGKIHLNSIFFRDGNIWISGITGEYLVLDRDFNVLASESKEGITHNFYPYKDGTLYNFTERKSIKFVSKSLNWETQCPIYPTEELTNVIPGDHAEQGWTRGLCFTDEYIFSGSSPALVMTILPGSGSIAGITRLSNDIRCAIHGLEIIPDGFFV